MYWYVEVVFWCGVYDVVGEVDFEDDVGGGVVDFVFFLVEDFV